LNPCHGYIAADEYGDTDRCARKQAYRGSKAKAESMRALVFRGVNQINGGVMGPDHKPSVLIVDNDDRVLWRFQELLEDQGMITRATWSGHEALAMLQSVEFDVLLVDDYLPDVHSHDFLERVNRLPMHPPIIVMHSAPPTHCDLQSYASAGVEELVNKFDTENVCRAVSSCCGQHPPATKRVY
jgi:CheY-like chemotaxis protein